MYNREKGILTFWVKKTLGVKDGLLTSVYGGDAFNVVPAKCTALLSSATANQSDIERTAKELGYDITLKESTEGLELTTLGKAAHASVPHMGKNAIGMMAILLDQLYGDRLCDGFFRFAARYLGLQSDGAALGAACSDEASGALTLNMGMIRYEENELRFSVDIRYPVTVKSSSFFGNIAAACGEAGCTIDIRSDSEPLYVPEDSVLIQKLKKAYEDVTGKPCIPQSMGGGTYARTLKNRGVAFGDCIVSEGRAHQPDEYIETEGVLQHAEICAQAIYELAQDE